jgi:hypothetical protein
MGRPAKEKAKGVQTRITVNRELVRNALMGRFRVHHDHHVHPLFLDHLKPSASSACITKRDPVFHRDELHLDEQGEATLDDAHAFLIDTMHEFMRIRPGTVIDITDRQHVRRIVPIADVMTEIATPIRNAA